ncbi:MAG: tRNA (adenosine(37)-N6)-dimethylallyltransferase MiaA [bacterium]
MKDIIVIIGPTTSGKTALSLKLAKKLNGEVISADSRQVYKNINLASGKITKKEMGKIPHHLIDVVDPKKTFTVSDFKEIAGSAIEEIIAKGKTPIICGGTGFYIDALLHDSLFPEVSPNPKLRKTLTKNTVAELFIMLKKLDAQRANTIDQNNAARLIRAIEIAKKLGKVPPVKDGPNALYKKYNIEIMYIDLPDEILFKKVLQRIDQRIKSGMIPEVKKLHDTHKVSWKRLYEIGLECRFVSMYLRGQLTLTEMRDQLFTATKQYIKRQRTWFKKYIK